MLLKSISTLTAFPTESLLIEINDISPSLVNSRVGINFVDSYYDYDRKLKWDNSPLLMASDETSSFFMISNEMDIPSNFPLIYTVSAFTDHLHLGFLGGASALDIYPSRPYPIITKLSDNQISISAGFLSAMAFSEETNTVDFRKQVQISDIKPLSVGTSLLDGAYKTSIKKGITIANLANDVGTNSRNSNLSVQLTPTRRALGLTPSMAIERIIRDSFMAEVTVNTPAISESSELGSLYYMYWDKTQISTGSLFRNRLLSPPIIYSDINGHLTDLNPLIVPGYSPNTPGSGSKGDASINLNRKGRASLVGSNSYAEDLAISFNSHLVATPASSIYFPQSSDITVWYETSAVTALSEVSSSQLSTNYYAFSSDRPPYLNGYKFSINTSRGIEPAFTINYQPSAAIYVDEISSISIQTKMIDNYYQSIFNIDPTDNGLVSRFTNIFDGSLSAIDRVSNITYLQNTWFPTSAVLWFINNGNAENYNITFETSSIYDSYFIQDDVEIILNRDKSIVTLSQSNITDNSVEIQASIFPEYDPIHDIIWSVFPPENVIIRDLDDPTIIIPQNTPVNGNFISVKIENLGVDDTIINLFTTQYNTSGSTTWIPSNEVWASSRLDIFGNLNDFNSTNIGTLSAMFIRNGFRYRTPQNANISWSESDNNPNGSVIFKTKTGQTITESVTYPSTFNFSNINGEFTTVKSESFPQTVNFRVNCSVFNPFYNYQAGKTFYARQYPANSNLFATVSSDKVPEIISTKDYTSIIYEQSGNIVLSADIQNIDISPYDIKWSSGLTSFTGLTARFEVKNLETCVGLSALSARPNNGGFGRYNFFDNICFYILSSLEPLSYISFPEYNYLPNTQLSFNNFTSEFIALTSYANCNSENIFLSATPSFDEYDWRIGNLITTTLDNTAKIAVFSNNISADNTISVSAYNRFFPRDNPSSIYNTVSSTGLGFKQNLTLVDFPSIELSINLDNDIANLRDITTRDLNINIDTSILDLSYGNFNLTLSSVDGRFSEPLIMTDNSTSLLKTFTYGQHGLFTIPENTARRYNLFVEGTAWKTINGFNFCAEQQSLTSNIVNISAFDGPDLDIWTDHNRLTAGEVAIITNTTTNTIFSPFTSFSFWNGYELQNGTISTQFSASYASEGSYSLSLSGFRSNGAVVSQNWPNFFIIDNDASYNENINRIMSEDIVLPYSLNDILVPSNAWQFDTTLNDSLNKLNRNVVFLNEQCFIADNFIPKYISSVYGLRRGINKWRYNQPIDSIQSTDDQFNDVLVQDDIVLILNGPTIEIRNNDNMMNIVNVMTKLTDIEIFKKPVKIGKIDDKIIVLDQNAHNLYVFEFDTITTSLKLTHYWGGIGDKNSRTKLNDPVDMFISNDFIFIVDNASSNMKVYNKHLNWINNIQLNVKPKAITGYDDTVFILTEDGKILEFIDSIQTSEFDAADGNSISYDPNSSIIYLVTDVSIKAYSRNGTFINILHGIPQNANRVYVDKLDLLIIYSDRIVRLSNPLSYKSIIDEEEVVGDNLSYRVHRNEPVTSFVINDSLIKIKEKANVLASSLSGKFVKNFSNDDTFLYSEIISDQISLSSCVDSLLGVNEIVSYETINRAIESTFLCISSLADYINGDKIYPTQPPIWTWEYHKISENQRPNLEKTPLSWAELVPSNAPYSGVTWNSIISSTGYENAFPVSWTWEDLEDGCLNAITWEEMEMGRLRAYRWDEIEQDDGFGNPFFLFDSCST